MKPANEVDSLPARRAEWLEGLTRAILDTALDCIITMDATGMVREFNRAAEHVFGYRRDEVIGRELAELIIPPQLRDRHRRGLARYLETGEGPVLGRRVEIAAVRSDGSEILVELAITASTISGAPMFTAYLRDITERVRNERRRAAQYNVASLLAGSWSLQEAGPQIIRTIAASGAWAFGCIWMYDKADARFRCEALWRSGAPGLEQFEAATRALVLDSRAGLPGRAFITQKATWIADISDEPGFPRAPAAAVCGLRGAFAFPLCADGDVRGVIELLSAEQVRPDDDLLRMVEALGSQIGLFIHRRQIEEELQRQKQAAEAANAAKDRFLAALSHELRTPLTPVLAWASEMAEQRGLPAELREDVEMVCRNINLEARLIDDLLDLTRISRGKLQLATRNADAHELLHAAIGIVRDRIAAKQLKLEIDLAATAHEVSVDTARVQQVFWNVLSNAAKFTPAHGTISVRSRNPTPARFALEISDTGVGIDPNQTDKIFDAFEQADAQVEGLGLGLAISKAIMQLHGGSISARSEGRGKGAIFTIELPTI